MAPNGGGRLLMISMNDKYMSRQQQLKEARTSKLSTIQSSNQNPQQARNSSQTNTQQQQSLIPSQNHQSVAINNNAATVQKSTKQQQRYQMPTISLLKGGKQQTYDFVATQRGAEQNNYGANGNSKLQQEMAVDDRDGGRDGDGHHHQRPAKHSSFHVESNYDSNALNHPSQQKNERKKTLDSHLLKKNLRPFGSVQQAVALPFQSPQQKQQLSTQLPPLVSAKEKAANSMKLSIAHLKRDNSMKHSIGSKVGGASGLGGSNNLFSHKTTVGQGDTDSTLLEAAMSDQQHQGTRQQSSDLTRQILAEKQSKDAATSHLRKQAFQRALIRNGANFDIVVQNPKLYGASSQTQASSTKGPASSLVQSSSHHQGHQQLNMYKLQQKSLEVTRAQQQQNEGVGTSATSRGSIIGNQHQVPIRQQAPQFFIN